MKRVLLVAARCFIVICLLNLVSGCAVKNEGAINYTKVGAASKEGVTWQKPEKKYVMHVAGCKDTTTGPCKDQFFASDDEISIHLLQGFIKEFPKNYNIFGGQSLKDPPGQIAVVVKAFELKSENDFSYDPQAADSGRLVYFSDDVRRQQFLNFSFLPVYGPVHYSGMPIALQIYVLQLRTDNEMFTSLLHTLAGIGSAMSGASAPILGVLDKLGTSILNNNQNDVVFKYYMTLYPLGGVRTLDYPVLQTGNYILLRHQDRSTDFDWGNVFFNPAAGRLYYRKDENKLFRDDTYLVLQVQKGFPVGSATSNENTLAKLQTKLRQQSSDQGASMAAAITDAANEIVRNNRYNDLRRKARELQSYITSDKLTLTKLASRFVDSLIEAVDYAAKGDKKDALSDTQLDVFMATVNSYTNNSPQVDKDNIKANKATAITAIVNVKLTEDTTIQKLKSSTGSE